MIQVSKLKKITIKTIVAVSVITNIIVGTGVAQATVVPSGDTKLVDSTSLSPKVESTRNFCTQLVTIDSHLNNLLAQHESKLSTTRADKLSKLTAQFATRDNEIAANRLRWDNDRNAQYEKLYSKAVTDTQKQAVDQFKTTIEVAVAKRRAGVDSAISAYRRTVEDDISTKQGSVNSVVATYKSAVIAAESTAQTSCNAGTDPSTVRESFKANLQTARTNLKTGKNGVDKINDEIVVLAKTRQKAIESAIAEFKATLNQARDTLKLAIKE